MKKILFVFLSMVYITSLQARPHVIYDHFSYEEDELAFEQSHDHDKQLRQKSHEKKQHLTHNISTGGFLTYSNLKDFSFSNGSGLEFFTDAGYRVRGYNLGASYIYRFNQHTGIGFSLQRIHTPNVPLGVYTDITYSTPVLLDSAFITEMKSRESTSFFIGRHYILPQTIYDPFFELGLGFSSQNTVLLMSNGSEFSLKDSGSFVSTIGIGAHIELSENLNLEAMVSFRNHKGLQFKADAIEGGTIEGQCQHYRAFDFKLALAYGW